jgi:hypothetical protein
MLFVHDTTPFTRRKTKAYVSAIGFEGVRFAVGKSMSRASAKERVREYHRSSVAYTPRLSVVNFHDFQQDDRHGKTQQPGFALVTALMVIILVAALLATITGLAVRNAKITTNDTTATQLIHLTDGHSDVARLVLEDDYKKTGGNINGWLNLIANRGASSVTMPLTDWIAAYPDRDVRLEVNGRHTKLSSTFAMSTDQVRLLVDVFDVVLFEN